MSQAGMMQATVQKRVIGPSILLASGAYFDYTDPEACDFKIEDVARGLSNECRFAGQCAFHYSVAQHSILGSYKIDPVFAYAFLMHDAPEAFLKDLPKPLKELCPDYKGIERHVEGVVLHRFGLSCPLPEAVKVTDIRMLSTEQRVLMRNKDAWGYCYGLEPYDDVDIVPWTPSEAYDLFLRRYAELRP